MMQAVRDASDVGVAAHTLNSDTAEGKDEQQAPESQRRSRFRIVEEMDVVSSINSLFQQFSAIHGKVRRHEQSIYGMKEDMGTKLELEGVSNQKADKTFVQKM